jgi:hypothetical protein
VLKDSSVRTYQWVEGLEERMLSVKLLVKKARVKIAMEET